MTADDLDRAHLAAALRLSTHAPDAQTPQEWMRLLDGRLSVLRAAVFLGERPSSDAALCLVADAMALYLELERAEQADPVSGVPHAA